MNFLFNKISIFGAGYVGFSLAVLLSKDKSVTLFDIDESKLLKINDKKSPIRDESIVEYFENKDLNLTTCSDMKNAINEADLIILALPTNFSEESQSFDTSSIDSSVLKISKQITNTPILIKSTVPIGYTKKLQAEYPTLKIIFSPEFLKEGSAIEDNLKPHRIIVGNKEVIGEKIAELFLSIAMNNPEALLMSSDEAEAVKLFSNAYLAARISFFNELDTYALENNLESKSIINGLARDPRIGGTYCNPSFGYGGYCLPKDTKQLKSSFGDISQAIFSATIASNKIRKNYIADHVLSLGKRVVGIYLLAMKKHSDNFKESSIIDVLKSLQSLDKNLTILIYEPMVDAKSIFNCEVIQSLDDFKFKSEIILTNRFDNLLEDVQDKVFTRDVFGDH